MVQQFQNGNSKTLIGTAQKDTVHMKVDQFKIPLLFYPHKFIEFPFWQSIATLQKSTISVSE